MEQAVLKALTQAMGSQSSLQLAAMQSESNLQSTATLVNNDLASQANNIKSAAQQGQTINTAQSWVGMILGFATVATLGIGAAAAVGFEALPMLEPMTSVVSGATSMVQGGLQIGQGVVQNETQDAMAQAGLDGATSRILGSATKSVMGAIQDGSSANSQIAQETTAAIQAYGRAQKER